MEKMNYLSTDGLTGVDAKDAFASKKSLIELSMYSTYRILGGDPWTPSVKVLIENPTVNLHVFILNLIPGSKYRKSLILESLGYIIAL